jgi:hypothetical protein
MNFTGAIRLVLGFELQAGLLVYGVWHLLHSAR